MVEIEIRELRDGDVEALLANVRPADIAESDALTGPGKIDKVVRESVKNSTLLWVGTADGEIVAIFGAAPLTMLGGQGIPWLIGTPLVDRHRSAFIRRNRPYIARMLAVFPHLMNVVDARNVKSIAWLKRLGFTVNEPRPMGAAGLPFHLFTLDA